MNEIKKKPFGAIGYGFIAPEFLPEGKDEYHLRNLQNRNGISYRNLTAYEIEVLVRNRNTSDDWNKLQVSDAFNPELVKNCKFYGLVRIGKLEALTLGYHNVYTPVGLYNSTIISCDFGDNVVISNVSYMSHYIIGSEVIIMNVDELHVTDHSKFGNGVIKEGESESVRVWLEVCNENAGRKILPFNGMLPGDAWLWSKFRNDERLMQCFREFTERRFDKQRGYYGKIGDRTVIKNTSIIKDVWIGSDAYIKGANKMKNLTINSSPEAQSQIGEGCELVNGIVGYGCRIFYGVKAVRFFMASHSQLKYGARLINSFLGNNATISCCEVLNSLIFPAHEQHHNNSFLCAALIMGQSNIAAGATLGSNHNSRAADGEMIAGRGFWPGLCVSLKHNSRFASFTLIAKGDYTAELDISLPFCLVSNDESNNRLLVMPAYWFQYNMYALARNSVKYIDRDKRINKLQYIEYDFLAPDSINEIFTAIRLLEKFTGMAAAKSKKMGEEEAVAKGAILLNDPHSNLKELQVVAYGFENSSRITELIKVKEAYHIYKRLVIYYGISNTLKYATTTNELDELEQKYATVERGDWTNIGGQLMPETSLQQLLKNIHSNHVSSWEDIHQFYQDQGEWYADQKAAHAYASLLEITGEAQLAPSIYASLLQQALETKEWMYQGIKQSRAKDYENSFRQMAYSNKEEMDAVLGSLEDNVFIRQQEEELQSFRRQVQQVLERLKTSDVGR